MIRRMKTTLAFDIYGTLMDPRGIIRTLERFVGDDGPQVSAEWRAKQIEYLFRRGLGRKYAPFTVCTRQALNYACRASGHDLSEDHVEEILANYLELPAFPDAQPALSSLKDAGFGCYALSNGEADNVAKLLDNAGLSEVFRGIVSANDVRSFKPDPSVYAHFLENTGALPGSTWLVSAHPFDVIGAMEVGWKGAWLKRDPEQYFDPWRVEPTIVVPSLAELEKALS